MQRVCGKPATYRSFWIVLLASAAWHAAGCSPSVEPDSQAGTSGGAALGGAAASASPAGSAAMPPRAAAGAENIPPRPPGPPTREFWEEQYLQGSKVGYQHVAYYDDLLDGEQVVRIETTARLTFRRGGQTIEQALDGVSWETPAGEVRRFRSQMTAGGAAQTTTGVVRNGRALLTLETSGKSTTTAIDWPAGTLGETSVADWLVRHPPRPGTGATLSTFIPVFNQVVGVALSAKGKEAVDVGGRSMELLRVEAQAVLPGGLKLDSTVWIDEQGASWKSLGPAPGQMTLRTTREQALRPADLAKTIDLDVATKVPVDPPLVKPYETQAVRYLVRLEGGDPAAVFTSGDSQLVARRDDGSAEIMVVALRPDSPKLSPTPAPGPTEGDRLPNNWIQSDDPGVARLAAEAAGAETDPWRTALALERSLRGRWQERPLGTSFATAADAARDLSGDCTEYAVLLAAMLRSRGIPARTAVGLVYQESQAAFFFHMWNEAYFGDRWIPLDAAWSRGGTSAAYLKIAHANLAGVDPLSSMFGVAQVMGRLKIEVLERR